MSEIIDEAYEILEFLGRMQYQRLDMKPILMEHQKFDMEVLRMHYGPGLDYCEAHGWITLDPVMRTAKGRLAQFMRDKKPAEVCDKPPAEGGDGPPRRDQEGTPRTLLTGWHDITDALDMKYDDRTNIKSLNRRFDGPITNKGKGTRPMVYKDVLFQWWDELATKYEELATKQEELANQKLGRTLMAEAQHDYGRDGTVAPEISGSVKKRRKRPDQT